MTGFVGLADCSLEGSECCSQRNVLQAYMADLPCTEDDRRPKRLGRKRPAVVALGLGLCALSPAGFPPLLA